MKASKSAYFWMYASAATNSLGMFSQCFVSFATYSTQHQDDDYVEIFSYFALAYFVGSAFFAWGEWKENVNYDGKVFLENYDGDSLESESESESDENNAALLEPRDDQSTEPETPEEKKPPFSVKERFTMLKVGLKDFLEVSFVYFATKLFIHNTLEGSQKAIAPIDAEHDWGLLVYYLLTLPFKYHSKIINSALTEESTYKTEFTFSAPLFWTGVMAHSLEHCLPLVLLFTHINGVKDLPEEGLFPGFVVLSVLLMLIESIFIRSFDGEACLERSAEQETNKWMLSPCFRPMLKVVWPYKPIARFGENVLSMISLLTVLSDIPLWGSVLISAVVSLPSCPGAYYVDVREAEKHLEEQEVKPSPDEEAAGFYQPVSPGGSGSIQ